MLAEEYILIDISPPPRFVSSRTEMHQVEKSWLKDAEAVSQK